MQGGGYCAELVTQAAGPRGAVCSTAEQAQRTPISVTVPFSDPIRPDSPVTVSGHVASATARLVELVYPDGGSDRVELGERGFYVAEVPPAHLAAPSTSMVWAVSHDRGTLLRVDPRSGRVVRRITLSSDPHGVAFGSGLVWVALYHESTIVRVDPRTSRISGPPTRAGFPTEPMAAAGGYLWAIPSVGGHLADPQLHTVLEIDARSGRILRSYRTRGRPRDVVAAGNTVWVATTEPNELVSFSGAATR